MSKLPENTSHQIWTDISSGMEHIHSKSVLNLDIKPENIFLSEVDLALRLWILCPTRSRPNGGTPRYTLPEYVLSGKQGCPADMWRFSIVMMLVLRIILLPFPRDQSPW